MLSKVATGHQMATRQSRQQPGWGEAKFIIREGSRLKETIKVSQGLSVRKSCNRMKSNSVMT